MIVWSFVRPFPLGGHFGKPRRLVGYRPPCDATCTLLFSYCIEDLSSIYIPFLGNCSSSGVAYVAVDSCAREPALVFEQGVYCSTSGKNPSLRLPYISELPTVNIHQMTYEVYACVFRFGALTISSHVHTDGATA